MCCTISQVHERGIHCQKEGGRQHFFGRRIPTSSNGVYSCCFMQALTSVFTGYVEDLFGEGYSFIEDPQIATKTCLASPPSLCSTYVHPDKSINTN